MPDSGEETLPTTFRILRHTGQAEVNPFPFWSSRDDTPFARLLLANFAYRVTSQEVDGLATEADQSWRETDHPLSGGYGYQDGEVMIGICPVMRFWNTIGMSGVVCVEEASACVCVCVCVCQLWWRRIQTFSPRTLQPRRIRLVEKRA